MNNVARVAAVATMAFAPMAFATGPISTLPMIDVSRMPDKTLTTAEIDTVIRGKQMVGDTIRVNGTNTYNVARVYEADGTLSGAVINETDKGKWYIDKNTDQLCNTWTRWAGGCYKVVVRSGKIHQQNPVSGTQFIQK